MLMFPRVFRLTDRTGPGIWIVRDAGLQGVTPYPPYTDQAKVANPTEFESNENTEYTFFIKL